MSVRQTRALIAGSLLLILAIWVARRPDQFSHPYIWAEEVVFLDHWQQGGFVEAAFTPVQGQLILSSSFFAGLIFSVSFLDFPVLGYIVATCWFMGLALLWLLPGSRLPLKVRIPMAFAAVLAPAGPETFGVLLFSFWWLSLWPVPVLFWNSPKWWLRVPVLLVAGFSSLAGSAIFIVFAFQWYTKRRREDAVSAAILFGTLVVQSIVYLTSDRSSTIGHSIFDIATQAFANLGQYPLAWVENTPFGYYTFVGLCAAAGAVLLAEYFRRGSTGFWPIWMALLMVLGIYTVLSAIPAPTESDPFLYGPRYYFLVFAAITWLMVALYFSPWKKGILVAGIVLAGGLITLGPTWSWRTADKLNWNDEVVTACEKEGPAVVRIHTYGDVASSWKYDLTDETCEKVQG